MNNSWDKEQFIHYLTNDRKLSEKFSRDIASRCLRLEKSLGIDLKSSTKTEERLKKLHLTISEFVAKNATSRDKAYTLSGNFRLALNYFSEFMWNIRLDPYSVYYRYSKK